MKFAALLIFSLFFSSFTFALSQVDQDAIQAAIKGYVEAWNHHEGKGFANGFTEDASLVNLFGLHLSGKAQIERVHTQVLQVALKGSTLEVLSTYFHEVQPGVVVAIIKWKLKGYRPLGSDSNQESDAREGVFTQLFLNTDKKWLIAASQSNLIPE